MTRKEAIEKEFKHIDECVDARMEELTELREMWKVHARSEIIAIREHNVAKEKEEKRLKKEREENAKEAARPSKRQKVDDYNDLSACHPLKCPPDVWSIIIDAGFTKKNIAEVDAMCGQNSEALTLGIASISTLLKRITKGAPSPTSPSYSPTSPCYAPTPRNDRIGSSTGYDPASPGYTLSSSYSSSDEDDFNDPCDCSGCFERSGRDDSSDGGWDMEELEAKEEELMMWSAALGDPRERVRSIVEHRKNEDDDDFVVVPPSSLLELRRIEKERIERNRIEQRAIERKELKLKMKDLKACAETVAFYGMLYSTSNVWTFKDFVNLCLTCKDALRIFMQREWYQPITNGIKRVTVRGDVEYAIVTLPGDPPPVVEECKREIAKAEVEAFFRGKKTVKDKRSIFKRRLLDSGGCVCPNCRVSAVFCEKRTPDGPWVPKRAWIETKKCFCLKCRCLSEHCSNFDSHVGYELGRNIPRSSRAEGYRQLCFPYRTMVYQKSKRELNKEDDKKLVKEIQSYRWPPVRHVTWSGNNMWPEEITYNQHNVVLRPRLIYQGEKEAKRLQKYKEAHQKIKEMAAIMNERRLLPRPRPPLKLSTTVTATTPPKKTSLKKIIGTSASSNSASSSDEDGGSCTSSTSNTNNRELDGDGDDCMIVEF